MAVRADIREELDRLASHVEQAPVLVEAARSAAGSISCPRNSTAKRTRCAPSRTTTELTNIGLALKAAVEQFREQVQNVE